MATLSLPFTSLLAPHHHQLNRSKPQPTGRALLSHRAAPGVRFSPTPRSPAPRAVDGSDVSTSPPTEPQQQEEEPYVVLAAIRSPYNEIIVVDSPSTRFLLLDSTRNVHSVLHKDRIWTDSYWDEFASLPAIVPRGPIAILGLGAGTAAHLILKMWPSLHLVGWELDEILVGVARDYFDLSYLENGTESGGSLSVRIGDALSPSATIEGGFAGIVVDLFFDGKVIPQLQEVEAWLQIAKKLMPGGRIMVNCAGAHQEASCGNDRTTASNSFDSPWVQNSTIKTLCCAFPGKLSWKRLAEKESVNYVALTGPHPDLDAWSSSVPSELSSRVKQWKPCELA